MASRRSAAEGHSTRSTSTAPAMTSSRACAVDAATSIWVPGAARAALTSRTVLADVLHTRTNVPTIAEQDDASVSKSLLLSIGCNCSKLADGRYASLGSHAPAFRRLGARAQPALW